MTKLLVAAFCLVFAISTKAHSQPEQWKAEGWKTDFSKISISPSEVLSGGPPKDGIPSIDNPTFIDVSANETLADRDPVIGLEINGDARAYPLRVLIWHEIVNDVVGEKPVTVTYCPLCNAALVFDAKVDGTAHTFGTTGKLRNSDLIMYDRTTETWWQQFSGKAIVGAHLGKKLNLIPSRLESWAEFKTRHPKGQVLVPNDQNARQYGRNPYVNYDVSQRPFLFNGVMPEGISPMARVVLIRRENGVPLALSMNLVREKLKIEIDEFQVSWTKGQASALHTGTLAKGRDVGSVRVTSNSDGRTKDVVYDVTFAFVANAFHPNINIKQE